MKTEKIQQVVEDYFKLARGSLLKKTRTREIAQARQIYCYLRFNDYEIDKIKTFERNVNEIIASEIGLNQATVRYAVKTVQNLIAVDKTFSKFVEEIEKELSVEFVEITENEKKDAFIQFLVTIIKIRSRG